MESGILIPSRVVSAGTAAMVNANNNNGKSQTEVFCGSILNQLHLSTIAGPVLGNFNLFSNSETFVYAIGFPLS